MEALSIFCQLKGLKCVTSDGAGALMCLMCLMNTDGHCSGISEQFEKVLSPPVVGGPL